MGCRAESGVWERKAPVGSRGGAQVGAERERSGKRSGAGQNSGGAERSVSGGIAERERSGQRIKSAAPATAPADILLFSLSLHVTQNNRSYSNTLNSVILIHTMNECSNKL